MVSELVGIGVLAAGVRSRDADALVLRSLCPIIHEYERPEYVTTVTVCVIKNHLYEQM